MHSKVEVQTETRVIIMMLIIFVQSSGCDSPLGVMLVSLDIFPPAAGPLPVLGSTQLSDTDWMFSVGDLADPPILILTLLPPPVSFLVMTISLSS